MAMSRWRPNSRWYRIQNFEKAIILSPSIVFMTVTKDFKRSSMITTYWRPWDYQTLYILDSSLARDSYTGLSVLELLIFISPCIRCCCEFVDDIFFRLQTRNVAHPHILPISVLLWLKIYLCGGSAMSVTLDIGKRKCDAALKREDSKSWFQL